MTTTATASPTTTSARSHGTVVRRLLAILAATVAMLFGFALSSSAGTAHADTVVEDTAFVDAEFDTIVECGGDVLYFQTTSFEDYDDAYAQLWVYDYFAEEWVTDENWFDASIVGEYNEVELTFEPGLYDVYVSYALWDGYEWGYSGGYIETYVQYYTTDDADYSDFCYMGNDLDADI